MPPTRLTRKLPYLLALGLLFACTEPGQEPVEFAPGSQTAPNDQERQASSQGRSKQPSPSSEGRVEADRQSTRSQDHAAPAASNAGGSASLKGLAGLEGLRPGVPTELALTPAPRVYRSLPAPFATMDREVGQQIFSMYQALKAEDWQKDGPALVVVRGDRAAPLVDVEVSFRLLHEPTNVDKHQLKTDMLAGGQAIATMHKGARSGLHETDAAIDKWLRAEGKRPSKDQRWYVFMNRPDQVPEGELMTAIIQPLE